MIVLKISQAKLSGFLSGGIQGIVLGVFSTPFVTRLFVTVVFISGLFRGARTGNELDPQPREGEIHELMMEVIEASVLYPAIILNVLEAHSESDAEQKIVSGSFVNIRVAPLTPTEPSLTPYTMVFSICLPRLAPV